MRRTVVKDVHDYVVHLRLVWSKRNPLSVLGSQVSEGVAVGLAAGPGRVAVHAAVRVRSR